jgi:urea transport system ATP-binding protein
MTMCAKTPVSVKLIWAQSMLELRNLHAGYGGSEVLSGVSFTVGAGEIVCLLGRNGMGKTTTLRAIMGLVKSTAGTIVFNGVNIANCNTFEIARAGIAYVPQGREIFPALTVEENLRLGSLRGGDMDDAYALFPILSEKRGEAGASLSGGQQQQLAVARALLTKPKLLLLDEPSEGIQPSIVQDIAKAVAEAARTLNMAVLLVEQNTSLALSIADRAILLEGGRITGSHTAAKVTSAILEEIMGL